MKHYSHLNSAVAILTAYRGQVPFGIFIKDFFRENKKFGSKDRKRISQLCYACFRLGKIEADRPLEERIILGLYLTISSGDELLAAMRPDWNETVSLSIADKLRNLGHPFDPAFLFPAYSSVTDTINREQFALSHLRQPDLFLRIRPGKQKKIIEQLEQSSLDFIRLGDLSLALPNASKVDEVLSINRDVVVQDYSSQRVQEFMQLPDGKVPGSAWDCCAASGGKSLLLYDLYPSVRLTVTDIRDSILQNLRRRFNEAGINRYQSFVADLSGPQENIPMFDLVMADVPCTGSGTWGRTPEQLVYFEEEKIETYAMRQRSIAKNVFPHIKPGGYLLYITCSVYRQENGDAVSYMQRELGLQLVRSELLAGYELKADTLFAALLQRSL